MNEEEKIPRDSTVVLLVLLGGAAAVAVGLLVTFGLKWLIS